jgi:hypothetical protein
MAEPRPTRGVCGVRDGLRNRIVASAEEAVVWLTQLDASERDVLEHTPGGSRK